MEVVSDALNQDARRVLKALLVNALNMVAANVVLNLVVKQVPLAKPTNVLHMEVVSDALNQDARRVPKALLVNVLNMVVANDVLNLDA